MVWLLSDRSAIIPQNLVVDEERIPYFSGQVLWSYD